MLYFLTWYLTLALFGLAALPLGWTWFRHLPDRGWGLLRPLGLLLVGVAVWLLGSYGLLKLNAGSGLGGALGLFGVGLWALQRWGGGVGALRRWLRAHRGLVLAQETLFFVALAFWTWYRIHDVHGIGHTEQPMDFALLNAILRGGEMPPNDPWLSGFAISYYYLGYLIMAQVTALSAVPPGVAYNLAVATLAALASVGAFSVVFNLVTDDAAEPSSPLVQRVGLALLGVLLLVGISNGTGLLTMLYHAGQGPDALYEWAAVNDMAPTPNGVRPPRSGWWWWKASRTLSDYGADGGRIEVIDEFPFFSFLLGDMHPHVLALPFALLGLGIALNALRGALRHPIGQRWRGVQLPPESWSVDDSFGKLALGLSALFVGAFGMLNTWDLPTQLALLVGVWLIASLLGAPRAAWRSSLLGWLGAGAALLLGAVALYLPFYVGFRSQAQGLRLSPWATLPQQYLLMFGLFWLILLPLVLTQGARIVARLRRIERRTWLVTGAMLAADGLLLTLLLRLNLAEARLALIAALFWGLIPFAFATLLDGEDPTPLGIAQVAGFPLLAGLALGRWTTMLVAAFLALTLLALWARARALLPLAEWSDTPQPVPARPIIAGGSQAARAEDVAPARSEGASASLLFALLLIALALLLTMGSEMFYIKDGFPGRMNTIFKLYYQAWVLMAVASPVALLYVARRLPRVASVPWLGLVALLVGGSLWYPVAALDEKADFVGPAHWDGRFWMQASDPDRFAAIEWLQALPDQAVIVEKPGVQYRAGDSALAGWTGHSTLIGWTGHELQWRGTYDEIGRREPVVRDLYTSTDVAATRALLDEWDVDYVALTPLEIDEYGLAGQQIDKFYQVMTPVFQQGTVTLFGR